MDVIGSFLEECVERVEGFSASTSELHVAYKKWCAKTGENPLGLIRFGRKMAERNERRTKTHGADLYRSMRVKGEYRDETQQNVYRGGD